MEGIFHDLFPSLVILDQRVLLGDLLRSFFEQNMLFEKVCILRSIEELNCWCSMSEPPTLFVISSGKPTLFEESTQLIRKKYQKASILFLDKAIQHVTVQISVEYRINGYWTMLDLCDDFVQGVIKAAKQQYTFSPQAASVLQIGKALFRFRIDIVRIGETSYNA